MRTFPCDTCEKPIAPDAQHCPHCGTNTPYGDRRRRINFSIVFGFFLLVLLLGWCSQAEAQGFYARTDLHGTLSRCVDAVPDAEWADCSDDGGEPGVGLALEAGYAPARWLDLGILGGGALLSSTGGTKLKGAYVMPVARLNVPAVAKLTPYVEAGYGFGTTSTCGNNRVDQVICDVLGDDKRRNHGGVLMVGGGLRWHLTDHLKPTLSVRRVDYTGDPRNACCHFDAEQSRRTNTWQLGIGAEWRP